MAAAASQVLPIVLQGEYRADGAFRALSRDVTTAATQIKQASAAAQMSASAVNVFSTRSAALVPVLGQVGKQTGLASYQMSNLGFQINDIASGLAMGQSPFTILAQQGGQIYQILSMAPGGVGGALADLKSRILDLVTPGRAIVLGFTAAAGAAYLLYRAVNDNAASAERALKDHERIIGLVKDAYRDAKDAAGQFHKEVHSALLLQAKQNLIALQGQMRDLAQTAQSSMTTPTSVPSEIPMEGISGAIANASTVARQFLPFRQAVDDFNASVERGEPNIEAFRDAVSKLALANPALATLAIELLKSTENAGELAGKIKDVQSAIRLLEGRGGNDDRDRLGLQTAKTAVNAYDRLIQRTKDRNDELRFEAEQAGKTGNAVLALKLQHDAERAAKSAGVEVNQVEIDQLKQKLVLYTNLKAQADLRSNIKFEREQFGRTESEQRVAATIRSANIDLNSAEGQLLAQELRINEGMRETRDLAREAFSSIISDLRAGKDAGEIFVNVLSKIGDRLASLAVDQAVTAMFANSAAAGGGGIFTGLGKLFGFAEGGAFRVGGSGGTDSQFVAFNASPDETVTVTRPDQQRRAGAGITNNNYTVHAPGATPEAMALAFLEIRKLRAEVPSMSVGAVSRARELTPGRL